MRTCIVSSVCSLVLLTGAVHAGEPQSENKENKENKKEWVLHVYDLRPLLKGPKGEVDFEMRDVHVRSLINLLKDSTGADNWTAGDATIREINGLLYVTQREKVHALVRQTLDGLMKEAGGTPATEEQLRKNAEQLTLRVYDLRPLYENIPQYYDVYLRQSPERPEDPKIDELITLLKESTGLENWAAGEGTIREIKGLLYVRQKESIHTQLRQMLADMLREKKRQVRIEIQIVKSQDIAKTQLSQAEFDELLSHAGSDATSCRTQLVCYNGQSAVANGGREKRYLEQFVANTEGGGSVSGLREASGSPLQEGLTVIVRPLIALDSNSIELSLRLGLLSNFTAYKPTLADRVNMEINKIPIERKNSDPKDYERADLFGLPINDASRLLTMVVAPKSKWVLAGSVQSPPEEKKLQYVFVKATIEP